MRVSAAMAALAAFFTLQPFVVFAQSDSDRVRGLDAHLEPAYFQPSGNDTGGSLGLKYNICYTKALNDPLATPAAAPAPIPEYLSYYSLNLFSKGNLPFRRDFPIHNFLESGLNLAFDYAKIGIPTAACTDLFCANDVKEGSVLMQIAGNYQFESDSDFNQKQHAYGLVGRLVAKPANPVFQYANPLEWGPSLVKAIAGSIGSIGSKKISAPKPFTEAYLPSLNIALEQVSPEKDDARKLLDPDLSTFARVRTDISYSSTLFKVDDAPYRISLTWRHFQEVAADAPVKDAKQDHFSYWTVALHTPKDVVVSYAQGKLPFDAVSEGMFKIGWDYNF